MTFSSLRVFLVATTIILFGHLSAADVRSQTIDRNTQRNGMHSCPPGQFVVGVHVRDNLLLCSTEYGSYRSQDERVYPIRDDVERNLVQGMHACAGGAMTGLHVQDNKIACAPVPLTIRGIRRYVDADNNARVDNIRIHTCPSGPVSGIHVSRNLLLCGFQTDVNAETVYVDAATQVNGMHSCPWGFIVGVHLSRNLLLCSREFGNPLDGDETFYKTPSSGTDMPTCPEGMAMNGLHVGKKWITCARVDAPSTQRVLDSGTQREGMHACPLDRPMAGLDVRGNYLICGTHGTPLSGPRINRLVPAEPVVGETFEIRGYNLGGSDAQRRWAVYLYQPTRGGESITLQLEIIAWTNEWIRLKLPANIPGSNELPSGTRYGLLLTVPGRSLSSNRIFPTIQTRSAAISRPGEPWIRAIYRDGLRELLWIYGDFPPIPYTGGTRGIPNGIELLIRRAAGGEATRTPMAIIDWRSRRMIAATGVGCNEGTHMVQFRTGTNPVHRSNEMPVTLDEAWCRRTTAGMERRVMHIEGVEPEAHPYEPTTPQYPRPGDWLDIFGTGFGDVWQPEVRVVELTKVVRGRAQVTEARVLNLMRGLLNETVAAQWSDFHILVEIPRDIEPADYTLSIWDKSARRRSNNVSVRITARVVATSRQ